MFDLVIVNGRVIDGTGNPAQRLDVAITDGRIVRMGSPGTLEGGRTIDADDNYVCPGFVDPHSHSDRSIHTNPTADSTIRQGVTTEIVGNCGMTLAPVSDHSLGEVKGLLEMFGYEGDVTWRRFDEYLQVVNGAGTSQNLGWLVGHNAVRSAAGVGQEPPTADELDTMCGYVEEAMQAGALGMSTGLEFRPGTWSTVDELVALNRVVGRYDGIYASHVRNRDAHLRESTEEFLQIVREGGSRGEYSHLNVRENTGADPGAWRETVDLIAAARDEGLRVLADTTPFHDGVGRMAGILPTWLVDQAPADVVRSLGDPDLRMRLRGDCDRYWRFINRGEWHRVRLLGSPTHPEYNGLSFPEIAARRGTDEWDAFFDLLEAAGESYDDLFMMGRLFTDEHLAEMISDPLISLGVDCWSSSIEGPLADFVQHPLFYSGHIHYLTHHVREKGTLRLEEAIRKMTSMPAAQFGLRDRGLLREGFAADVVVFDFDALDDGSTVAEPLQYVRGVAYVIVNGVIVVDHGDHTGARPGVQLSSVTA